MLDVRHLTVHYRTRRGPAHAVDDVSFGVARGQVLGLVGESGCGKTTIALALMGLLPESAELSGAIELDGTDLARLSADDIRAVRGARVAMIFQGAMNALNPVYPVRDQIVEAILAHEPELGDHAARERVDALYEVVGLPTASPDQYPHEYSGGMKQRAVIAMALACNPQLVIADEPTTALDVLVQDRILDQLRRIQRDRDLSLLYVSHDMGVVAEIADIVAVMYAGRIVEMGPTADIFARPVHPYTAALMASSPSLHGPRRQLRSLTGSPPDLVAPPSGCRFHPRCPLADERCGTETPPLEPQRDGLAAACWHPLPDQQGRERLVLASDAPAPNGAAPLVELQDVEKVYPLGRARFFGRRRELTAVRGVSLTIGAGEAFGLVGESGSGKTTVGRMLLRLTAPTAGRILVRLNGSPVEIGAIDRRAFRRGVQMIFQDPYESLNPRLTIGRIVAEPLEVLGLADRHEREAETNAMLERVGLAPAALYRSRFPHELSGGQRQRVAIARAMIVNPRFVVADEPTSMLDVSVRTGIMDLLAEFKRTAGVSYLYITHDLAVARYLCDRIAVMHEGRLVELGATDDVLERPQDDYTRALIAAVPDVPAGRT